MKKWIVLLLFASVAFAQEDPVAKARHLAQSGDRAQALSILEQRLKAVPTDTDARTLYGTILSWNGEFDRARQQLEMVLQQQPNNVDAQQALANVVRWSRQTPRTTNEVSAGGTIDDYQHSDSWREAEIDLKHREFVLRAAHGRRFGLNDDQVELEAYPRTGKRSYFYAGAGYSNHGNLYPRSRFGLEYFQGFGSGYEASLGFRRLNFSGAVNLTTASLSKYAGDWLFTLRGYHAEHANSAQLLLRRYSGDTYVGLRIGKGSTRDEIRSATDLQSLDSVEAALEGKVFFDPKWFLQFRGGAGRQDIGGVRERHTTASALLGARF